MGTNRWPCTRQPRAFYTFPSSIGEWQEREWSSCQYSPSTCFMQRPWLLSPPALKMSGRFPSSSHYAAVPAALRRLCHLPSTRQAFSMPTLTGRTLAERKRAAHNRYAVRREPLPRPCIFLRLLIDRTPNSAVLHRTLPRKVPLFLYKSAEHECVTRPGFHLLSGVFHLFILHEKKAFFLFFLI